QLCKRWLTPQRSLDLFVLLRGNAVVGNDLRGDGGSLCGGGHGTSILMDSRSASLRKTNLRLLIETAYTRHIQSIEVLFHSIASVDEIHLARAIVVADHHDATVAITMHNPAACGGSAPPAAIRLPNDGAYVGPRLENMLRATQFLQLFMCDCWTTIENNPTVQARRCL